MELFVKILLLNILFLADCSVPAPEPVPESGDKASAVSRVRHISSCFIKKI